MPERRPRSQSAAETTGLKWAPEIGPNIKMSTVRPRKVAVRVLQQLQTDVVGGEPLGGDAGADDDGDQQPGAEELSAETSDRGRGRVRAG